MSDTGTPPRMVETMTADGVSLPQTYGRGETEITKDAKELARLVVESMEYDVGLHILAFNYGVPLESIKRMSREHVRAWGRGGFPKQTHCYECGQKLPD